MTSLAKNHGVPSLPEELQPLSILASNMYFSWNRRIRKLFREIDPLSWESYGHNPIVTMQKLSHSRIEELRSDVRFCAELKRAYESYLSYVNNDSKTWFRRKHGSSSKEFLVAYFSAEFGIASVLKTYSGGLGILSGDHLKSSSDLGVPIIGIGIFYRKGYFSQEINDDGWQIERYPENDPGSLPIEPVESDESDDHFIFRLHVADRSIAVRVWKVQVGRASLYLLDTNVPRHNSPQDCEITAELYGGDSETRIQQEMILGFGGVKLLRSLRIRPTLFHMNEGHSCFVALERMREIAQDPANPRSFKDALEIVKASTLFTTHTPVPAGIDIFTRDQIARYLSEYVDKLKISFDELFSLGQETPTSHGFNMAVLAIRTSSAVNAVSNLHGHVARKLWEKLLLEEGFEFDLAGERNTISAQSRKIMSSITNGIHIPSWTSDAMAELYDELLSPNWIENDSDEKTWQKISHADPEHLWKIKCAERAKLVDFIRADFSSHGWQILELDPDALTVGFARRFATYKRANLLFSDPSRLTQLLADPERPIQFVFAGKAHPRDHEGKKLIQEIISFTMQDRAKRKIVFLPDYEISIAQRLVQGVDLWMNNPRRPLEASGTSGMKVLSNGGLNLSILDGWWDEAYTPSNGWAIGKSTDPMNPALQDRQDAESLYDTLQHQVLTEFYDRANGTPIKWVERMKRSIASLSPKFSSNRMVREYTEKFYLRPQQMD
ncbi:MAG: alpha-glucan family phosphorylase [Thaumarchaeota archaeon]|nr:alpha-glucan family phosphorylase [Nitrososphaerota archaeon]